MTPHEEARMMSKRRMIEDADWVIQDCDHRISGERPRLIASTVLAVMQTFAIVLVWFWFISGFILYYVLKDDGALRQFIAGMAILVFWASTGGAAKPDYAGLKERREGLRTTRAMRDTAVHTRAVAAAELAAMEKSSRGL
jgi:hypothetical protein